MYSIHACFQLFIEIHSGSQPSSNIYYYGKFPAISSQY